MEDLQRTCDEATKELANKRKVLQTAGFKLESQEEDLEHAKKIRRVEAWAEKHGGIDRLQKLLNFQDKRTKHEYQSMLAGMALSPQDVVAVKFAHPKEYTVFGVVLAEPDLAAPYEVHMKLCGEKTDTVACAPARAQLYEVLSSRNVEDLLTRVATVQNLDVVYEVTGSKGDKNAFRNMYVATSMANIVKSPPYHSMRGQLLNWAKHLKDRINGGNAREERRANAVEVEAEGAPTAAAAAPAPAAAAAAPEAAAPLPTPPVAQSTGHTTAPMVAPIKELTTTPIHETDTFMNVKVPLNIHVGSFCYALSSNGQYYAFRVPKGIGKTRLVCVRFSK